MTAELAQRTRESAEVCNIENVESLSDQIDLDLSVTLIVLVTRRSCVMNVSPAAKLSEERG
jgi:hypothetical protein